MTDRFHRSISFKRQTSSGSYSKPLTSSWAGKGPALGRCLSVQDSEPQPRDVSVDVEGKVYHLHSSLMNKASPVFPVLVAKGTNLTDCNVHIDDITTAGFDEIFNWVYYERVQIKAGHLQDVYKAARKLQVEDVERMCDEYIETTTNPDLQGEILQTCIELNLDHLLKHVLSTRAEIVLNQASLGHLDLNHLTRVLSSDHLNIRDEVFVLQAAKRWMAHRDCTDDDVHQILRTVRLGLLSNDDLEMILDDLKPWPACQDVVKEATTYLDECNIRPLKSGDFCRPRGSPKCFFFGGLVQCDPDPTTHIPFKLRKTSLAFDLDSRISHVDDLACMTDKVVDPVTLSKHNVVFAVGGYVGLRMNNKGDGNLQPIPGNLCLRYEARIDCWDEMAPLSYSRWCHGAAWCDDYILVIGGVTKGCLAYGIGTVELYDIASNTWSLRSPFPYGIRNLAACDVGGRVFISGGCVDYKGSLSPVDHVYWYDFTEDMWHLAGHMCKVREYHSMAGKDHEIFIVGGSSDVTAEIFDTLTQQSTFIEAVPGQLVHSPLPADNMEDFDETEEEDDLEGRTGKKTVTIPELAKFNIAITDEELIVAGGVQQMNVVIYNMITKEWSGRRVPFHARRYNTSFALLYTPSGAKLANRSRKLSNCSVC